MASRKCAVCNEQIKEEYGKLDGSMIKVKNLKGKNEFIYACSDCQKEKDWIEKAKVRAV